VVLAELPGGVAVIFERGGNGRGCRRHADIRAGLSDCGQAGTLRQLTGDEVGPPCGTACLGIIIGKNGALGGQLVDIPLCQDRCRLSLRDFVCEGGIMVGGATLRWCLPGRSPEGDWTVDTSGRGLTPPPTIEATNSDALFRGI
jgi:hypothetical protein